jgi:hypothetical protein
MQLPPDWSAFLGALKHHGGRFLVVGAHALAAHGRPRATQDLDVLVAPTAGPAPICLVPLRLARRRDDFQATR